MGKYTMANLEVRLIAANAFLSGLGNPTVLSLTHGDNKVYLHAGQRMLFGGGTVEKCRFLITAFLDGAYSQKGI